MFLIEKTTDALGDSFRSDAEVYEALEHWLSRRLHAGNRSACNSELIERLEYLLHFHKARVRSESVSSEPTTVYRFARGGDHRWWFIGKDSNDIWCWDRGNQTGLNGTSRAFRVGDGAGQTISTVGPWASNRKALLEDTGIDVPETLTLEAL